LNITQPSLFMEIINYRFFGEKEDCFNVQLVDKKLEIDLQFAPLKSIALIGEDGKPDELYYYSFTKNEVQGQIRTEQGTQKVTGQGWFDHQWGWDYALLKGTKGGIGLVCN
jgi:Predicted secreted hydrolase